MVRVMSIVQPLYIYPGYCALNASGLVPANCWYNQTFTQIQALPHMNFTVVINPQPSDQGNTPSTNWQGVISKLNQLDVPKGRVRKIGYVDSNFTKVTPATFQANTQYFANWGKNNASWQMDGIFIDDMTPDNTTTNKNYYANLSSIIKNVMGTTHSFTMMNPGTPVDSYYYTIADNIVSYEGYYNAINATGTVFNSGTTYNNCPKSKQSIIAHDFKGSLTDQQQFSDTMGETYAMGWFFLTDGLYASGNPYANYPTQFTAMVDAVNSTDTWMAQHPTSFPSKRDVQEKRAIEWKA